MFEGKVFDADEATKILPLISSIIKDVVAAHDDLERILVEIEETEDLTTACLITDTTVNNAVLRLQEYVDEVEKYGGIVRNSKFGTVDFAGRVNGEVVWYCWTLGESNVCHFHPLRGRCECRKSITKSTKSSSI